MDNEKKRKMVIVKKPQPNWSIEKIVREAAPYGWQKIFQGAAEEIADFSEEMEKSGKQFYPSRTELFKAFELTPLNRVRVVIVGQDPYPQTILHGIPRAMGMSFSVRKADEIPSSLNNIFKELLNTVEGFKFPGHGDLTSWAKQGVLLLNMSLTVEPGNPNAHKTRWDGFIYRIVSAISEVREKVIYVLWGNEAKRITQMIGERAIILEAAHPSGRSANRGFFGCNHFNEINDILTKMGEEPINWNLE